MSRFMKLSYATLMVVLAAAGCADERAPRSFVQPNVIKKTDLQGTWYYLQTVTDTPPTSGVAFIGLSSELMKIKFDVQEGFLYARRAYEQINNSEDAKQADPANYAGQILSSWRISSQFDIIRDYNSTTGEETNKIIESTERPWNEREFIRVDWSQALNTDFVGIGLNFWFDDAKAEPVSYWESDPTKPDAFHMERVPATDAKPEENPNQDEFGEFEPGEANYFDLTNKLVLSPTNKTICYEEGGKQECFSAPSCLFRYQVDDCAVQTIKVRHAFSKISPKHDYQPRKWDGRQMDMFGIWDVGLNRLGYNRQYGITNSGIQRHAARFNLWKKSYDASKTPIPYAQRELRTIPYYAESSLEPFPPELFEDGREVIRQWNEAAKVAVKAVTGAMPTKDVFVWCHNPVKLVDDSTGPKDHEACKSNLKPEVDASGKIVTDQAGNAIYRARQGDPRRSTIFWVNQYQAAGPLGYGPPMFDIETGETLSGQAYIFGGALDSYTARSRDLVLLLTGRLGQQDFIDGLNVKEWVEANRAGAKNYEGSLHDQADVDARMNAMDFSWARGVAPHAPIDRSSPEAFMRSFKERQEAMYKSGVFGNGTEADLGQTRRDRLRNSPLEGMMITRDVMDLSGVGPGMTWNALGEAEKARISPLRSQYVRKEQERRIAELNKFGFDTADFADEGMAQRAIKLAQDPNMKNLDPEAIRQQLRRDIFLGVTLHEVGHNMGMRHNFRASFDAMNYFPEYWQARAASPTATARYAGIDPSTGEAIGVAYKGTDCNAAGKKGTMRPRYIDCPGGATSVEEVTAGVREYQYSSIMDYGAEFNSDFIGLGHYDKAAMKFSYAGDGYVEVFKNAKTDNASQLNWAAIHAFSGAFGFPSPLTLTADLASINYTEYPALFENGIADIEEREDVPFADLEDGGPGGYIKTDSEGRYMVPYFFCSDEFVGNLTCQRFDSGADAYEQGADLISRYQNYYLVNNFKRDRYQFYTSSGYLSRIAGRYLDILREQLTWYSLLRASFTDWLTENNNPDPNGAINGFFNNEKGWGNFTMAVSEGFDLLGKIITMPEAGSFALVPAANSPDYPYAYYHKVSDETSPQAGQKAIGLLDGKYTETTWDFDSCGYYWADECQTRIGYFIDKTVALDVMSQSQAYFTGRDTSTDVRKYAIGYYTLYKKQIQEKLGGLLAGDYQSVAPYFNAQGFVTNPGWTLNNDGATKPGSTLIDPATGFSLQLYAGVYGLSSFPSTFDQSFIDTTRIFVVGNGEAPIPDNQLVTSAGGPVPGMSTDDPSQVRANGGAIDWLIWKEASTGKTYAARSYPKVDNGQPQTYRNDTAARMLETARLLQNQKTTACAIPTSAECSAKTLAFDKYRQNIDIMRSLHNAFGYARYESDAPFFF